MLALLHSSEVDQPNQALRIDQQVASMQIVVSKSNYNRALQRIYQGLLHVCKFLEQISDRLFPTAKFHHKFALRIQLVNFHWLLESCSQCRRLRSTLSSFLGTIEDTMPNKSNQLVGFSERHRLDLPLRHSEVKHPPLKSLIDDGNDLYTVCRLIQFLLQDGRHRLYRWSFGKLRQTKDATTEVNLHDGAGLRGIHQDGIFHRRGGGTKEIAVLFGLLHLLFNTFLLVKFHDRCGHRGTVHSVRSEKKHRCATETQIDQLQFHSGILLGFLQPHEAIFLFLRHQVDVAEEF
mmetsp:Transcript_59134/g.93704  ORF Transcript_59134/g.93704 Transcript_59134/m.93704 type:complete len:291 (+) Transcript_59134:3944-4816(+)